MASGTIKQPMQDTGWITLNSIVKYRRLNDVVYVKFSDGYTPSASTWVDIGTLPDGFRPSDYAVKYALDYETNWWANIYITTGGIIRLLSNYAASGQVSFALG